MLTYRQKLSVSADLFASFGDTPEKVLFFDIETTGLSAEANFIYLICVGFLKDGLPTLLQWFSETPKDEPAVIQNFYDFIRDYSTIVHFNGATFDIPFVNKRAEKYGLSGSLCDLKSVDILKYVRRSKTILGLSSCGQKAVEQYMGIAREDKYDGGQLIEVYQQYLGRSRYDKMTHGTPLAVDHGSGLKQLPATPSEALLYLLLLHNAEDVEGLIKISALMPLLSVLAGERIDTSGASLIRENDRYIFTFKLSTSLTSVCKNKPLDDESGILITIDSDQLILTVPLVEGELKHFFPNYKDYYYLPEEDYAIYKSAGAGVDKSRRKNATAATCYIKKTGRFLPICPSENEPDFKYNHKSTVSFCELSLAEKKTDKELITLMQSTLCN